jgi:hypothetical protein
MMIGRLALALLLAGCGRVGFQEIAGHSGDDDAGGGGSNAITLVVTSDETSSAPGGAPITGATVMIERSTGALPERLATDATGTVQFAAAGVAALHVAFRSGPGWRVYSVQAPPSGTIALGGRSLTTTFSHSMRFALPDNGSSNFWLHLGASCAIPPKYGSPSFTLGYVPACEGKTTRVIAFTTAPGTTQDRFIDVGDVTLTNGAMKTVTGTYAQPAAYTVQLTGLPGLVGSAGAGIYARSGLDLTHLGGDYDVVTTPGGGTVNVPTTAAPGGNTLWVSMRADLPIQYDSSSERIAPAVVAGQMIFDARTMVPLFSQLMLTAPPSVSWTGGAGQGTILALEITSGTLQWDAYLPPSATSARFPSLPSDLGVPVPASYDFASLARLDIPGATTADLARTIDHTWPSWPLDGTVFPANGSGMARIVYSVGLGPP